MMEILMAKPKLHKNNKNLGDKKSPTGGICGTSLAPIDDSFMYIETSSSNNGNRSFVSLERTIMVQIGNIGF